MAGRDAVPGMGALLKAAREAAGLSQAGAAAAAGVDRAGLVRFENESRVPSVATLMKLADAYRTTVGELVPTGSADPASDPVSPPDTRPAAKPRKRAK